MSVLNGQDQGTIILSQQDYIPLTVESFLIDRKAHSIATFAGPSTRADQCRTMTHTPA